MKKTRVGTVSVLGILALTLWAGAPAAAQEDSGELAPGQADEALFANDLGPTEIDVSSYPAGMQKAYRSVFRRCTKCHSRARPLNSQYLELDPNELAEIKKTLKEKGVDESVLLADDGIWNRYVKRMMRKPGSGINKSEGKRIWEFLRYDSKARKTGKNLDAWIEQRRKLLEEFKKRYPAKYLKNHGASKD